VGEESADAKLALGLEELNAEYASKLDCLTAWAVDALGMDAKSKILIC
jgi:hypothetical protein